MIMKIDKQNNDVAFNEEKHIYFNVKYPDRKYTSVTTLIGEYHEKFDADFWSSYKALESLIPDFVQSGLKFDLLNAKKIKDISPILDTFGVSKEDYQDKKEEILLSYKTANEIACERGSLYHNKKENLFYEKTEHKLSDFNLNLPIDGMFNCGKHDFDLNRDHAVIPEYLMYFSTDDGILNLAGQADLIVKNGNDIYILDYKTNAKGITTKAYFDKRKKSTKKMYYPINNLDDSTLTHYTLQLSIYAWILQRLNPEFNIKLLRLLHIDGNDNETEYDLPYIKSDVERLLKDFKKKQRVGHYRETGKIIKK